MPAVAGDKTDVLIFANGDRLTGDVKSLERGMLRFNTDATGTISIEWDEVAFLSSNQNVQVETEDGSRYLGNLIAAGTERRIIVAAEPTPVEFDAEQVVVMTPIEDEDIERLDGAITAGYSFTKASSIERFSVGFDIKFRTEMRIFSGGIDAILTDSDGSDSSQRASADLAYTRLWPDRWLTGAVVRLDRNDELELDLRTSIGVGGGRILRQTNSTRLQLIGGVQVSIEDASGGGPSEETIEGYGSLSWDWFRYDSPALDLTTNLEVFPNLTDWGRLRSDADIKFNWEMVEDLFWQLKVYHSFDSDPVAQGEAKSDYGIVTSLGYSF